MKKVKEVKIECRSCYGTGIYSGFCEAEGIAVVCLGCNGSGCTTFKYTPFEKRRRRRGIKIVKRSRGSFIATGVGPTGEGISYSDFFKGKMPS